MIWPVPPLSRTLSSSILPSPRPWSGDDLTKYILSQGTEINAEVRHGRNALHYAADAGKVPIVRFLLDNMAIIDVRTYFVNTVIWWFWNHDYIFA